MYYPSLVTSTSIIAAMSTVLTVIFSVALYILFAYSLYEIVRKQEMPNPWLAWIPIVNMYCVGKLVGNIKVFNLSLTNMEIILPLAFALFVGLKYIPLVGFILSAIGLLVLVLAFHVLYEKFDPENAFLLTIITAILPVLAAPVILFIYRNK
ncbi:MAG TPA: hypothetical protein PLP30_12805 [Clostridia bacterium]|jgi:uncharacterized membrane protein YbhN (UPF0104 family)|nr:hypothetical protein [Clostridia bacterium]